MHTDFSRIWPFMIAALLVYSVYRRLRRNFGRQPVRPIQMGLRVTLLLTLAASLLPRTFAGVQFIGAELGGLTLGWTLAMWGASRTRFEMHEGRMHYLPHTRTGIAVSLLFVGRLAYRMMEPDAWGTAPYALVGSGPGFAPSSMVRSPFTLGLLFVLIGYYVCYYAMVLWKSKHLSADDLEASSPVVP